MANAVVTKSGDSKSINVVFNDMAETAGIHTGDWMIAHIVSIQLTKDSKSVVIYEAGRGSPWLCTIAGVSGVGIIVDTVAGATPTSNDDLRSKIRALM